MNSQFYFKMSDKIWAVRKEYSQVDRSEVCIALMQIELDVIDKGNELLAKETNYVG